MLGNAMGKGTTGAILPCGLVGNAVLVPGIYETRTASQGFASFVL